MFRPAKNTTSIALLGLALLSSFSTPRARAHDVTPPTPAPAAPCAPPAPVVVPHSSPAANPHVHAPAPAPQTPSLQLDASRLLLNYQDERRRTRAVGPWIGIALSTGALAIGPSLIALGVEGPWDWDWDSDTIHSSDYEDDRFRGMIAAGSVIAAAGVIGIIASSVRLKQKYRERRRLDREIRQLRLQGVSVNHGPPQKPAMLRF